ncbi:DNA cytosine methyltransferase [Luteolibacter algae]|uniref:DNA (cytosine-5-)-methyltransferase n=1 Tax=Luteolibacter algae TaxID=454151 RepID=A0ABW5D6X5_9BACT
MLECIDLFCGAGGLSLGLQRAGITVKLATDLDAGCEATYRRNFGDSPFLRGDITELRPEEFLDHVESRENLILAGGPPCQLFSRLNKSPRSNSREVAAYMNLIRSIKPAHVVFENVPAIKSRSDAWNLVITTLKDEGYHVEHGILRGIDFGLPQKRERMIVLASRNKIGLPMGEYDQPKTVREKIGEFPDTSDTIPNHVSLKLSAGNLARIRQIRAGENSRARGTSFSDSYSRLHWDAPAPTITTKCISFSNGRFGHPQYDRALTVREAATLQGFPHDFIFCGDLWSCARQVGNAVPPPIGEALGNAIFASY